MSNPQAPNCPRCGKSMRLRTNGRDGSKFYGCSQYPNCRATVDYVQYTNRKEESAEEISYECPADVRRISDEMASEYQKAVWAEALNSRHIIVDAVAGSGKTTTCIVELLVRLFEQGKGTGSVEVMAFGKEIGKEIAEKIKRLGLGQWVRVSTTHAFGYRVCRSKWGSQIEREETGKLDSIMDKIGLELPDPKTDQVRYKYLSDVRRDVKAAVELAKNTLAELATPEDVEAMANHFCKDWETPVERLHELVLKCLELSQLNTDIIDFTDMLWLPVSRNVRFPKVDLIVVDEVQDLNACQHRMVEMLMEAGSRVIAVGDPNQAIFGFRGAMSDSMERLLKIMQSSARGGVQLPLSVTYRCPRSHVALAAQINPLIRAADNASEGVVTRLEKSQQAVDKISKGDLGLCRTNAPLISVAYRLLRQGKAVTILGRNFGANVAGLIKKLKAKNVTSLLKKVEDYRTKQAIRLEERESALQAMHDQCDTIIALCEGHDSIKSVLAHITNLFKENEDVEGIVLCTVHKAKGLESDTVFIFEYDRIEIPSKQSWMQKQERNIHYVALTRSKETLVLVNSERRR